MLSVVDILFQCGYCGYCTENRVLSINKMGYFLFSDCGTHLRNHQAEHVQSDRFISQVYIDLPRAVESNYAAASAK